MATWTAATALASGALITNSYFTNTANAINFLGAADATYGKDLAMLATGSTTQSITAATWTAVNFNTADEIYDVANGHSANGSKYTAVASGKFLISGYVGMQAGGTNGDTIILGIRLNGSGTTRPGSGREFNFVNNQAKDQTFVLPTLGMSISSGQYIELMFYSTSAVTIGESSGNKLQCGLQIQWVGA